MKESLQYLRIAVKRNLVGAQQHMNYYGTITNVKMFNSQSYYLPSIVVKHYAFLVDGNADSSVKSFLEGDRSLEEFQKVVLCDDIVSIIVSVGDQLLSRSGC